jgi:UDP-N-acetylmuramate--alanine ligase
VAVVNNIALTTNPWTSSRLFADFTHKARVAVLNLNNGDGGSGRHPPRPGPDLQPGRRERRPAGTDRPRPDGVAFTARERRRSSTDQADGARPPQRLNALAAWPPPGHRPSQPTPRRRWPRSAACAAAWSRGHQGGVTVIGDFAHNPDKITATLATLRLAGAPADPVPAPASGRCDRRTSSSPASRNLRPDDLLVLPDPIFRRYRRPLGDQRPIPSPCVAAAPSPWASAPPAATPWWRWPGPATASW